MCPVKPVVSVRCRRHPAVSANPDHPTNVIPIANVTQTGVFQTLLPVHHLPADVGQLIPGNEAFVGPVESACFSYLPPNTCTTTPYFNAGLLRECKIIHSEATPILYTQNNFVLHDLKETCTLTDYVCRHSLGQLRQLRIEVLGNARLFRGGGLMRSDRDVWNDMVQHLERSRTIKLTFPDYALGQDWHMRIPCYYNFMDAIRYFMSTFASLAEDRAPGPRLLKVRTLPSHRWGVIELFEDASRFDTYQVNSLPLGGLIQLTGVLPVGPFNVLRQHTRNDWRFQDMATESADSQVGSWEILEWIRDKDPAAAETG